MRSRYVDGAGETDETGGEGPGAGRAVPPLGDLVLRTPPNWTAVAFLGLLGGMHLGFAAASFAGGRWEAFLSLMLGIAFVAAAVAAAGFRFELAVLPSSRRVRLRYGVGRLGAEWFVPFAAIRGVRLTFADAASGGRRGGGKQETLIELLCAYDSIECPPTAIPRQEALYLAMALNVPLIKVSEGPATDTPPTGRAAAKPAERDPYHAGG